MGRTECLQYSIAIHRIPMLSKAPKQSDLKLVLIGDRMHKRTSCNLDKLLVSEPWLLVCLLVAIHSKLIFGNDVEIISVHRKVKSSGFNPS